MWNIEEFFLTAIKIQKNKNEGHYITIDLSLMTDTHDG